MFPVYTSVSTKGLLVGDGLFEVTLAGVIEGKQDLQASLDDAWCLNKSSTEMFLLRHETKELTEDFARCVQLLSTRAGRHMAIKETPSGTWTVHRTRETQRVVSVVKLEEPVEAYDPPIGVVLNNCIVV